MSFKLDSVVPWGRNLDEYRTMFMLDDADMKKKICRLRRRSREF